MRILEGIPSSWIDEQVSAPFIESGLIADESGTLVPTERGMLLLNELVLALTADGRPSGAD